MNLQLIQDLDNSIVKNIKLSEIKKSIFSYGKKIFFTKNQYEYTIYFNHYTNLYMIKIKTPRLKLEYQIKKRNLKLVREFIKNV